MSETRGAIEDVISYYMPSPRRRLEKSLKRNFWRDEGGDNPQHAPFSCSVKRKVIKLWPTSNWVVGMGLKFSLVYAIPSPFVNVKFICPFNGP